MTQPPPLPHQPWTRRVGFRGARVGAEGGIRNSPPPGVRVGGDVSLEVLNH